MTSLKNKDDFTIRIIIDDIIYNSIRPFTRICIQQTLGNTNNITLKQARCYVKDQF
jgi:hypothetical protein